MTMRRRFTAAFCLLCCCRVDSSIWNDDFDMLGEARVESLPSLSENRRLSSAFRGDQELCPCLSHEELSRRDAAIPPGTLLFGRNITLFELQLFQQRYLGPLVNASTYGVFCGSHDALTAVCNPCVIEEDRNEVGSCVAQDESMPKWCKQSWCYVDPNNCKHLLYRLSVLYPFRYWSYATCRNVDVYTDENLINSITNKSIRITLTENSGGWVGSYVIPPASRDSLDLNDWTGPVVDFVRIGAEENKFHLVPTRAPKFLSNRSAAFFSSDSPFDLCVYAATLGFTDLCVSSYFITNERATVSEFVEMGTFNVRMVTKRNFVLLRDRLRLYSESVKTIFLPFSTETWMFVVFFVVPLMGVLVVVHEFDLNGSVYHRTETVVETSVDKTTGETVTHVSERRISMLRHVLRAIYSSFLAVLQGAFVHPIVSLGGFANLMGICFFILTIVSVYTANLAAILTSQSKTATVDSLSLVVERGQRICADRQVMQSIIDVHNIGDSFFVVDPVSEGGDGKPGFNCPNCASRRRVLDFLDPDKADDERQGANALYCHVALINEVDLEIEHTNGHHCNKTLVGNVVLQQLWGMPVYEGVSRELIALFLKMKNEAILNTLLFNQKPVTTCVGNFLTVAEETSALNITQLSGIWVVSFGISLIGLVITMVHPWYKRWKRRRQGRYVHVLNRYDQYGQRISRVDEGGAGMQEFNSTLKMGRMDLSQRSSEKRKAYGDAFQDEYDNVSGTSSWNRLGSKPPTRPSDAQPPIPEDLLLSPLSLSDEDKSSKGRRRKIVTKNPV